MESDPYRNGIADVSNGLLGLDFKRHMSLD